jgi:pyruvate carboxylase
MKMDASITSPVGSTLQRLAIGAPQQVEGADLLIVVA